MILRPFLLLSLICLGAAPLAAQDAPAPPSAEAKARFEETHLIYAQRDVFGIHYFYNGQELADDRELEALLSSVDDEDTLARFRSGQDRATVGWFLIAGGSAMAVTGGVLSWQNGGNTATNLVIAAGLLADGLGGFLWRDAQMDQLGAIDRYNALVRQDNGFSLLDLKGQGVGLAWMRRF